MSDAADAGTTSIARLACTYMLPHDVAQQASLRARLDRVAEKHLTGALASALAPLDSADPGAVWVVRTLRTDAVVSATSDDLDLIARQWGRQIAGAIIDVLSSGPGGNVVRFASHAAYVAAFGAAIGEGRAHTWVFEPLAGLRLLSPASAIRSGADRSGSRVTEVVAEIAALRRLEAVIAASPAAQTEALWQACVAESAGRVPAAEVVERVVAAGGAELASGAATGTGARALRLFAAVATSVGRGSDVVAAVDAVARGGAEIPTGPARRGLGVDRAEANAAGDESSAPADRDSTAEGSFPDPTRAAIEMFAAVGAPAFLVLPALAAVGLDSATAPVRARVLGRLLQCSEDDAAIRLASGDDLDDTHFESLAFTHGLVSALAVDERVDGRWLVADVVDHPDGRRVGLLRDAVTDTWLAGSVVDPGAGVPWISLIETTYSALARRPEAILGEQMGFRPPVDGECAEAVARLRPAADDVAWLAPRDDLDLAHCLVARAALRLLARRLLGFDRSSMAYLVERFLPPGGVVTIAADMLRVELPPAPLQVLLVMAGLDTFAYRVTWLDRDVVVTHGAG
jgi:hypothetical protein